ncbi:MAG: Asp-tRNA(Asn)/Glu-tRNA(Gln) amidotransferase subunit GatB [Candidatus Aenigmarchaeota archaeon]|nr:Asp-tRNA(Asn)/Glu-tRNA(Gln) amidotransferase subunit GatB [Candidatus Aenigmarchaeota archaeon]
MQVKIGLETHVQLNSKSKIFCGCRNPATMKEEPEPNTLTCPTCLGLPGSKPRFNRAVLDIALRIALALNCNIQPAVMFSRKTYFYPDLAKNYQITQYEVPVGKDGHLEIVAPNGKKRIRIRRIHMEEDPAKLVHSGSFVLVDYNRSGTPLAEIVTEPDFSSPEEARLFLQGLETILEYLQAYDPDTKAVFKSDANISLAGGERVEVKNITGTKEIEKALKYEMVRQANALRQGLSIERSTVAWNPDLGVTQMLREKESEEDYGYIFDPDLVPIDVTQAMLAQAKHGMPELPHQKYARFVKQYGISQKLAEALVAELEIASLFEQAAGKAKPAIAATFIAGDLKKTLNWNELRYRSSGLKDEWILYIVEQIERGKLTDRNAEMAARRMVEEKRHPKDVIKEHGLESATLDLQSVLKPIVEQNAKAVEDYRKGEKKAFEFLVGQAMRATKGTVQPEQIRKELEKLLK